MTGCSAVLAVLLAAVQAPAPAGAAPIAADDSATAETIERLLEITNQRQTYDQVIQMFTGIPQMPPQIGEVTKAFVARYLPYDSLKVDAFRVYRESVSESDLLALIRFHETEAGRRLLAALPLIMGQMNQLTLERFERYRAEFMEMAQKAMPGGV